VNFKKSPRKKQSKFKKRFPSRLSSLCPEITYGKVLDDATSIDVVVESAAGKPRLFVHTQQSEFIASEFRVGNLVFRPGPLGCERLTQFPEQAADFGSPEELLGELRAPIEAHGFSTETSAIAAFFSIATWFADAMPQAPVLSITGPEREATLLLDLLACTTRRGLRVGEFDHAVLRVLPMEIGPTLLINSAERSPAARQLFRTTNYRGVLTPNSGRLADFCVAKAVYDGRRAFPSRDGALRITLLPFSGRPPVLHTEDATKLARHFQPKLVSYRARFIHATRASLYDVSDFAVATRNLAQIFGSTLAGCQKLERELCQILKGHENHACEEAWSDFATVVLEVCVHKAHTEPGKRVSVGQVASKARFVLSVRGDETKHSDREVGAIITGFGIKKRRYADGWMFSLDPAVSGHLHHLAQQHGELNLAPAGKCKFCDARRLLATQDGGKHL